MTAPLVLLLALVPALAAAAPLASTLEKEGLSVVRSVKKGELTAVLLRAGDGSDKLRVYAARPGKAVLVYLHPGAERLELLDAPNGLAGEAPAFLYRSSFPGLGLATLNVLRVEGRKIRAVGRFPDARLEDLDGDGRPEIVSRERPLGRFLSSDCDRFHAVSDKAVRTEVRSWRNGRFEDVSGSFPDFFDAAIARAEEELPDLESADRLGAALALYYDHAAKGEKRRGWERLSELFESLSSPVPGLAACARRVKEGLREKLGIPEERP